MHHFRKLVLASEISVYFWLYADCRSAFSKGLMWKKCNDRFWDLVKEIGKVFYAPEWNPKLISDISLMPFPLTFPPTLVIFFIHFDDISVSIKADIKLGSISIEHYVSHHRECIICFLNFCFSEILKLENKWH